MTPEQIAQMQAELNALKAENLELSKAAAGQAGGTDTERALSFKYSAKGGVSVYGLGRFPVTLYANQWRRLFSIKGDILNFVETGVRKGLINEKPVKEAVKVVA
jgi:hypothetical protein